MPGMSQGDYVLGTQQNEVRRLGLQHRVWRRHMLEGWSRAGIVPGMTAIDVGAGPGFATTDLAEIVGPEGRVIALERSPPFLAAMEDRLDRLGLTNVEARLHDVAQSGFGDGIADAIWCRWLLSFVTDPAATVRHVKTALKPGGVAVFHEYADYGTWRLMPPNADVERFRDLVIRSWRDSGGEPNIALQLPELLKATGMEIIAARPIIEIVGPNDFTWRWPAAFMAVNATRLHALGYIDAQEAQRIATVLDDCPHDALMITPLVAEIVARKP